MSLLGIIAIRKRSANTPTSQIEEVFKKLHVNGSVVDSDDDCGIRFVEVHESPRQWSWVEIVVGVLTILEGLRVSKIIH